MTDSLLIVAIDTLLRIEREGDPYQFWSIVVAAIAVIVSIGGTWWNIKMAEKQYRLSVEHNRLSVKPAISFQQLYGAVQSGSGAGIFICNSGLGPAFVKGITVIKGDERFPFTSLEDARKLLARIGQSKSWICIGCATNEQFIMRPGETHGLVWIESKDLMRDDLDRAAALQKALSGVKVEVEYNSLYCERQVDLIEGSAP